MYPNGDGANAFVFRQPPRHRLILILISTTQVNFALGELFSTQQQQKQRGRERKENEKMHLNMLSALYKHDNCWNSYLYSFLIA